MVQPRDVRGKFQPPDIREYARTASSAFNVRAHRRDRGGQHIHHLLYTSKPTLTAAEASTPFVPTFSGLVVGFRLTLTGAPVTTAFQVDIHLEDSTIFNGDFVEVAAGSTYGYRKPPNDKIYLYTDKKLEVITQTVSSATGPFVLDIEYVPG